MRKATNPNPTTGRRMMSTKLTVKKPLQRPQVFQSKGVGRRSGGQSGKSANSGGLSPRSAVFSAGLAPPGHPDKKLMDEVLKLRDEKDKLNRSIASLKVQLSERDGEIKVLSSTVEQMLATDVPPEGRDDPELMDHVMFLQNLPSRAANAQLDTMSFLQEWNKELLAKVGSQAFEIADLVSGSKDGKDSLIESLSCEVKSLASKLLLLTDSKGKSSTSGRAHMSPMSSPPASPPHAKRSAATSYQHAPTASVPPEIKRLLSAVPPPETTPEACTPYLTLLRETASRLRITDPTDHPRPVNPKSGQRLSSGNTLLNSTTPLPARRSVSADRQLHRRGDSYVRTKSLGAKDKESATTHPPPTGPTAVGQGQGSSSVSQTRGARLSKATTTSSLMKQRPNRGGSADA